MEIFFDPILFGITCVALVVFIIGSLVWDYFKRGLMDDDDPRKG